MMDKKVAIVTLIGYSNYGNRLQNYALQEVLNGFGVNVYTIIWKKRVNRLRLSKRISNLKKLSVYDIFYKGHMKLCNYIYKKELTIRTDIFKRFTNDYIRETEYSLSNNNIPESLSEKYDYFITGSDQVWNPAYNKSSSIYFLTFASKEKRIAYAPSFGVSEIRDEFIDRYKEWISGIDKLSVREYDGAKIIKNLIGVEVPVLIDPTMLLTESQWNEIAKEPKYKPNERYLLTYFLGKTPKEYNKKIKRITKSNNLKVVKLGDIKEKETYRTGPSEFLSYIKDCSLVCTDSFHGAVFSIIYKKPFIVYKRVGTQSMYSRINTLLDKFNLHCRKVECIDYDKNVFDIDYSHITPILETEREKAIYYLKSALKIRDEE
jgi:hypothetical protein